jgi:hypothetical protein
LNGFAAFRFARIHTRSTLERQLIRAVFSFWQVKALEFVGLAPKGSQRVQNFLEQAAEGLVEGGK